MSCGAFLAGSLSPVEGRSLTGSGPIQLARWNQIEATGSGVIDLILPRRASLDTSQNSHLKGGPNDSIRLDSRAGFYGMALMKVEERSDYALFAEISDCPIVACGKRQAIGIRHLLGFKKTGKSIILPPGRYRVVVFASEKQRVMVSFKLKGHLTKDVLTAAARPSTSDIQRLQEDSFMSQRLAHADVEVPDGGLFLSARWMSSDNLADAEWGDCFHRFKFAAPAEIKSGRGCEVLAQSSGGSGSYSSYGSSDRKQDFSYSSMRVFGNAGIGGVRSYGSWFQDSDAHAHGGYAAYLSLLP